MSTAAIVLLIVGILFFIASFFLPEGRQKTVAPKVDNKLIKEMVDKEVEAAKGKIGDMVEETSSYSIEKTERAMEKLSNEKIMAIDEYSETVLKKIDENHKEAVFLYDMLNKKDESLKTAGESLKEKTDALEKKDRALEVKEEVLKARTEDLNSRLDEESPKEEEKKEDTFVPFIPERVEIKQTSNAQGTATKKTRTVKKPVTGKQPKVILPVQPVSQTAEPQEKALETGGVELHFEKENEGKRNRNDEIRKLHEEGKSNMAIARELGLGVGEVKLVIDLYANKK